MGKYFIMWLIIMVILQSCDTGILVDQSPAATVAVGHWEQDYYQYLEKWSDIIEVWYTIRNTGSVDIDYYKIWLVVTCTDGSTYEDWTNGLGLDAGHSITDNTYIKIPGKIAQSIRITEYELTTW